MRFEPFKRLKLRREFDNVFKHTDFKSRRDCLLLLAAKNQLDTPRLGLVVAKKYLKRAIKRNTVKRIIRESFRLHLAALPNLDIVILVCKPCNDYDKLTFWQSLDQIWQNLQKKSF